MPAKPGRWYPSVVAALLGGLILLTLALLDTGDKLSGWLEALYVIPALLFAAAAAQMVRNALASGRA
jgi:peptidoglycan/LPS O-acetylase OafA/YrhL